MWCMGIFSPRSRASPGKCSTHALSTTGVLPLAMRSRFSEDRISPYPARLERSRSFRQSAAVVRSMPVRVVPLAVRGVMGFAPGATAGSGACPDGALDGVTGPEDGASIRAAAGVGGARTGSVEEPGAITQLMELLKVHPLILDFVRHLKPGTPARLITERMLRRLARGRRDEQLDAADKSFVGFRAWKAFGRVVGVRGSDA